MTRTADLCSGGNGLADPSPDRGTGSRRPYLLVSEKSALEAATAPLPERCCGARPGDVTRASPGGRSGALLAVGLVMTALTQRPSSAGGDRPRSRPSASASRPPWRSARQLVHSPIPATQLGAARRVAESFLGSYLAFAYHRGSPPTSSVTPALRRQLGRRQSPITPVERDRHPRVVSLRLIGTTPRFIVATATVDDGGITGTGSVSRSSEVERAGRWPA